MRLTTKPSSRRTIGAGLPHPFWGSALQMSSNADSSAMAKSRAPFRMPRNSPDDSKSDTKTTNKTQQPQLPWNKMGLLNELTDCLEHDLQLKGPTPVQSLVVPELLKHDKESLAFLAATGSGKTLAYLLPLVQQLKQQELFENYERRPRRPRLLILVPTRELALQITSVLKSLSHSVKLSSQALVGGQDMGKQRKGLASRPVDVVVATPGRLLKLWKEESVFLGSVNSIVLDEMDTMLEQGFQKELRAILYPLLYSGVAAEKDKKGGNADASPKLKLKETAPRVILTSATMTQTVQKLLGDNPKTSNLGVTAKRLHGDNQYEKLQLPPMKIVSAPGLHKAIPRLEQVFVDVGNTDKISLLVDVISSNQRSEATIIFCNTAASVRAVQYALQESRIESLSYHGELNSAARAENLQKFRQVVESDEPNYLVCTDLAARGLDIPKVDHIVMFDFPLNAMDYLHRSGRTARGAGRGKVTALVAKRDKVLASGIEQAVVRGDPLDGLSSRKSDYASGAKSNNNEKKTGRRGGPPRSKRDGQQSNRRGSSAAKKSSRKY